ncbi:MAG: YceI family protein [Bacteroidetes bacterium]|nr:YceI family protein [Bacteroidota bacterium]
MKINYLFLLILFTGALNAQIFLCKDGNTSFTSEAPLELIKAQTNKTSGVLDCAAKNVAFSVDVAAFDGFNSGLQKEHFHENYLESSKYPKATFKGKIIEDIDFTKKGTQTVRAKGVFNIHGVDKEKIVKVKVTIKDKEILVETNFEVPLEDHNIKVPKVVNQKIASIITVDVKANLKPKS